MKKFIDGSMEEILPNKFDGSYYVQVTQYDINGQAYTTDAVLQCLGNNRYGFDVDSFTLITENGQRIDPAYLFNPNNVISDFHDLIKVYDVSEEEFGNATVDGLSSLGSTNEVFPTSSSSSTSSDESPDFSIDVILNGGYKKCAELLYEPIIATSNVSTFLDFQDCAYSSIQLIQSLKSDIYGTLNSTGSVRFNEASELAVLDGISSDGESFLAALGDSSIDNLDIIVDSYNEKLKEAKRVTRKKLLEDKVSEINSKNIVVSTNSYEVDNVFYPTPETYEDNIYLIRRVSSNNGSGTNGSQFKFNYLVTETKYFYISLNDNPSIEEIESRIIKTNNDLPYDRGRIVDYEG